MKQKKFDSLTCQCEQRSKQKRCFSFKTGQDPKLEKRYDVDS